MNVQRNLSSIKGGGFVLVFFPFFLLRGAVTFDFTVRRSMVTRSVADGNLRWHGSFLQWALTK